MRLAIAIILTIVLFCCCQIYLEQMDTPVVLSTYEEVTTSTFKKGKLINTLTAERGDRITETKYKLTNAKLVTYDGNTITSIMEADTVDLEFKTTKLAVIKAASWYGNFKRRQYNSAPSKND